MLSFIKYLLSEYKDFQMNNGQAKGYDEDGNYIDPKIGKLTDDELLIPAEKARILHSKSAAEVKLKARKKIFHMIHREIKNGKTSMRLEMYMVKPDVMEYIASLGYTIETITPPPNQRGGVFNPTLFDDDGEEIDNGGVYRYYKVSWGVPEAGAPAEESVIAGPTAVEVSTATVVNALGNMPGM